MCTVHLKNREKGLLGDYVMLQTIQNGNASSLKYGGMLSTLVFNSLMMVTCKQLQVTLQRGIKVDLAQTLSGLMNGNVHNTFAAQVPHNHKPKF